MENNYIDQNLDALNIFDFNASSLDYLISILALDNSKSLSINLRCSRLLRSIEVSPFNLVSRLRKRNNLTFIQSLSIFYKIQYLFLKIFEISNDYRFLNCVLKLHDSRLNKLGIYYIFSMFNFDIINNIKNVNKLISFYLKNFTKYSYKSNLKNIGISLSDDDLDKFLNKKLSKNYTEGVVIFSPSSRSLYTLCVAQLLISRGVRINYIVVKRVFSFTRIFDEINRDGFSWVIKKFFFKYPYGNGNPLLREWLS